MLPMLRLFLVLLTLLPLPALAEKVALVIGMGAYQHVIQLKNTINDARNVGATLEKAGFKVTYAIDATQSQLLDTMETFSFDAETADIALIYYAGHGVEASGENYLIPVDAEVRSNKDVQRVSVSLAQMLKTVESARKMRVVILDACRNNPFGDLIDTTVKPDPAKAASDSSRSTGVAGLAPVNPEQGTLVAFAAKEGQVALDGAGGDSPYATALMQYINQPGLEISLMFRKVRDQVLKDTQNLQEPYTYGSLSGDPFFLAGETADGGEAEVADAGSRSAAWSAVFDKPDTEAALRQLADQGDARSMVGVAYAHQSPGTKQFDPKLAFEYFKKAAEAGFAEGQYELAVSYEKGLGTDPDPAQAVRWYQAAADAGYPDALNDMGFLYFQGELGVPHDPAKGIAYFRQAADLRQPEALFNYARMIDLGQIPDQKPEDAAAYLYRAIRSGTESVINELTTNPDSFSKKTRIALQKLLKDHQFFTGKADGKFGPAVIAAINTAAGVKG